jgi:hypothetical protein
LTRSIVEEADKREEEELTKNIQALGLTSPMTVQELLYNPHELEVNQKPSLEEIIAFYREGEQDTGAVGEEDDEVEPRKVGYHEASAALETLRLFVLGQAGEEPSFLARYKN